MKRRTLAGALALTVLGILILAAGSRTAPTVWADASSIDWDVFVEDPAQACPDPGTSNDGDGVIEAGECPDVTSSFWLQPEGGPGGGQSNFDRANVIWATGPLGIDVTGDTIPDPSHGLVVNRPSTPGAKVGEIALLSNSNLHTALLLYGSIDDIAPNVDAIVTGQPIRCGSDLNGDTTVDTLVLQDTFELWNAITDDSNGTVSALETQTPDPTYPDGCDATGATPGADCAPKGVTMLPVPIPAIETAMGIPPGSAVSRSYGIARLPIVAGISSNMDVNFLVYSLHDMGIDGYLNVTLVQYPGLQLPDPTTPAYNSLAQIVDICPPYWSAAMVYGSTAEPDFDEDGTVDMEPGPSTRQLSRLIIGTGGPYDYTIHKSTVADFDGDTIPAYADRCGTDPLTGSASDDADGDTVTGTCDINGEGVGCGSYDPTHAIPWHPCQDVDGDTYLNYVDNCPAEMDADLNADTVVDYQQDTDGDGVGDVCDPAPTIPGDGEGYPGLVVGDMYQATAPGMFVDRDNVCSDPFALGAQEPYLDGGRWCVGFDSVPAPAVALGRAFTDSDDADPDLLDHPAGGSIEWMDTDTDSDSDGHTDACEAFMGSDALDASSVPPTPAGDCDSDGTSDAAEETAGTDPFTGLEPDADQDGCSRAEELAWCGDTVCFQDQARYDFFDAPVPANGDPTPNGGKNGAVTMGDVLAVLRYVGTLDGGPANMNGVDYDSDKGVDEDGDTVYDIPPDGVPDGQDYDRSPSPGPNPPWDAGPPNGAVTMGDVLVALSQVGLGCSGPP